MEKSMQLIIMKTTNQELVRETETLPAHIAIIKSSTKGCYPKHWHDGIEIIYVKEGTLEVSVDGEEYALTAPEYLVIGSRIEHEIRKMDENPGVVMAITALELEKKENRGYVDLLNSIVTKTGREDSCYLASLLNKFYEVYEIKGICGREEEQLIKRRQYLLDEILLQSYSVLSKEEENRMVQHTPEEIDDAITQMMTYLEEHYAEGICTQQIADMAGYSREHMCRYFKQKTGYTVKQYLTEIRLNHIVLELIDSNETLLHLALRHGFTSEKGFIASFKARYRILPSEFRERIRVRNHKREGQISQMSWLKRCRSL